MRTAKALTMLRPTASMMRVPTIFRHEPVLWPMLLLLLIIYIIPHTPVPGRISTEVYRHYNALPDLRLDFHPQRTFRNRFSTNRTALYIETREDIGHVTPLLLHMTQVIPPEWRFVFIGSPELVHKVNQSSPVRRMIEIGKLRLGSIDYWTNTWKHPLPDLGETHSRLLTNLTFYEEQFHGVEWLMVFRSSAMICANANRTVNDYLDYDWVGAPWNANDRFGGNGGLSLRRLSKVREVLEFQERLDNSATEDRWLSSRIGLLPGANPANITVEQGFAVEDVWAEKPLGYHINPTLGPGTSQGVWGDQSKRKKIFEYCPEIKIIMNMRLERERCPPEEVELDPVTGKPLTNTASQVGKGHFKRHAFGLTGRHAEASPEDMVQDVLEARSSTKSDL